MDDRIRKLQLTQLEILKVVDKFCRNNNIQYSLYAGTLIGAIRHKGFIPWDDDLDICMARDQYEKFIKVWDFQKPKGYLLQNKENTPGYTQSFTKIRKEHTTLLQPVDDPTRYHVGISIDVFPVDRIPDGKYRRLLFQFRCILYQLFTKEYVPINANRLEKILSKIIFIIIPRRYYRSLRNRLFASITKYNNNPNFQRIMTESMKMITTPLPINMMNDFIELPFEDGCFMCTKEYDQYLRSIFGDYLTPPPQKERVGIHNAIVIDFEHDYDEYLKIKERQ